MQVVTLTTDFGNKDHYVAALKGELLKALPGCTIIDISHHIRPFNISEAAFILKNAWNSFPENTVHLTTVNDQDEREVKKIAAAYMRHYFIGWDNGMFNMVFHRPPDAIVELAAHKQNGSPESHYGSKVFTSAAALLANGKNIADIGSSFDSLSQRMSLEPVVQESLIRGTVIHIDSFQNVIVNVTKTLFTQARKNRNFSISYRSRRNETINRISENYYDVPQGEKLSLFNGSGYLEIAINCGEAGSLLGIKTGDYIQIDFE